MSDPFLAPLTGPGSQPPDEDGGELSYLEMPAGMMTFAMPDLPEPDETDGLGAAKAVLARLVALLRAYRSDGPHNIVDLTDLGGADRRLIGQVLGEGEVSVVAGAQCQAQEAVLAGVWRVRVTDAGGRLVRDAVEVAGFPTLVSAEAFRAARPVVDIPSRFEPSIFNAPPLLSEINEHIGQVAPGREPHVINLSLLPHTEDDLALIDRLLGRGALTMLSRGYGNCRVAATATKNVWWVRFYNSQDALILNSIEITPMPEVVRASAEDIADSADRLAEILEVYR